ncbi:hypothetical protein EGW08_003001, partial [Elysia chlorotica]
MVSEPSSFSQTEDKSTWSADFSNLTPNEKYYMSVKPSMTDGSELRVSAISLVLKEVAPPAPEQLSVSAVALSCSSALVTYRSVSGEAPTDVRLSQANSASPGWEDIAGSVYTMKQYAILTDLQPDTTYFVRVQARLGMKSVEAVTHVTTQSLEPVRDLAVTVMSNDSSSLQVDWQTQNSTMMTGSPSEALVYKVTVEQRQPDDSFRQLVCSEDDIVPGDRQSVVVPIVDLTGDNQYRVSVTPFSLTGQGLVSEVVLTPEKSAMPGNATTNVTDSPTGSPTVDTTGVSSNLSTSSGYSSDTTFPDPVPTNSTVAVDVTNSTLEFTSQFPDEITVVSGSDLDLSCSASGEPAPQVYFYKNGQLVAQSQPGDESVDFREENITSSFTIQCVANNFVRIVIKEIQVLIQEPENISVDAFVVPVNGTEVLLRWMVTKGDIQSISFFVVTVFDDQGALTGTALVGKDDRSLGLGPFTPNKTYKAVLRTLGSDAQPLDEDSVEFSPLKPQEESDAGLNLDVTEIRENEARLDIAVRGPSTVETFTVGVYEEDPQGSRQQIQFENVEAKKPFMRIENLQPESTYRVVVLAFGSPFIFIMEEKLFNTSAPGVSGPPVLSNATSALLASKEKPQDSPPEPPTCPPPVIMLSTCDSADSGGGLALDPGFAPAVSDTVNVQNSTATPTMEVQTVTSEEQTVDVQYSTATVDVQDSTATADVQDSTVTVNIQDSTATVDVQDSTVTADVQDSTVTVNIQDSTATVDVQDSTVTVDVQDSTATVDVQYSTATVDVQDSTATVDVQDSTATVDIQDSTVTVDIQDSTATVDVQDSTATVDVQDSTATVDVQDSTAIVDVQDSTVTADVQDSTVTVDVQDSTVTVDVQDSTATADVQDSTATVDVQDSTATVDVQDSTVTADVQDSTATVDVQDSTVTADAQDSTATVDVQDSTVTVDVQDSTATVDVQDSTA